MNSEYLYPIISKVSYIDFGIIADKVARDLTIYHLAYSTIFMSYYNASVINIVNQPFMGLYWSLQQFC